MKEQNDIQKKIENVKKQIDDWITEFTNNNKKVERFDVYEGNGLNLGFIAYKDNNNNLNVLISIHGQKPTNSVSFPVEALEDVKEIMKIIEKYDELFNYIKKYETKTSFTRKRKTLLE